MDIPRYSSGGLKKHLGAWLPSLRPHCSLFQVLPSQPKEKLCEGPLRATMTIPGIQCLRLGDDAPNLGVLQCELSQLWVIGRGNGSA